MLASNLPREVKSFITILSEMSDFERDLLTWRFIDKKSMKETAKLIKKNHKKKITDSRIKQIEDKLIKEIQFAFDLYL